MPSSAQGSSSGERRREKRRRREKHRRRGSESSSSEEDETPEFPAWKTGVVVAIIVGCFALLYPKMFHPMLMFALGLNTPDKAPEPTSPHPPMRPPPSAPKSGDASHIHAGPHPAMRMAAGMGAAKEGAGGKGKGIWHSMLPFYTVGVIIFLLYTLSKIMWKSPDGEKKRKRRRKRRPGHSESSESESESEAEPQGHGRLSPKELGRLQKRLNQTEGAMQSILGQLESLSGNVDQQTAEQVKKMTMTTLQNLARVEAQTGGLEEGGSKTKGRRKEPKKAGEGKYLEDLEKALSEFKQFTEDYVAEHAEKAIQEELSVMSASRASSRRDPEPADLPPLREDPDDDGSQDEDHQDNSPDEEYEGARVVEDEDASSQDSARDTGADDQTQESEDEDPRQAAPAHESEEDVEAPADQSQDSEESEDASEEGAGGSEQSSSDAAAPSRGFDAMEAEAAGELLDAAETSGEIVRLDPEPAQVAQPAAQPQPQAQAQAGKGLRKRQRRT